MRLTGILLRLQHELAFDQHRHVYPHVDSHLYSKLRLIFDHCLIEQYVYCNEYNHANITHPNRDQVNPLDLFFSFVFSFPVDHLLWSFYTCFFRIFLSTFFSVFSRLHTHAGDFNFLYSGDIIPWKCLFRLIFSTPFNNFYRLFLHAEYVIFLNSGDLILFEFSLFDFTNLEPVDLNPRNPTSGNSNSSNYIFSDLWLDVFESDGFDLSTHLDNLTYK